MSVIVSAELGINHSGDPDIAEEMIRAAKRCGCDAVKVQSYREADIPPNNPEPQALVDCQIWPYLERLSNCAHREGLLFGVTASSVEGVQEAVAAGADFLKNASEAILRHDIIGAMVDTGLPVWVSTGMASTKEIDDLDAFGSRINRMLCTSLYPCPDSEAGLERLRWLGGESWLHWPFLGFSDHTQGWAAAPIAVALGVEMVEKHFTLDNHAEGPDHWFSADPHGLSMLVRAVRKAEVLLGDTVAGYMPLEVEGREKWRMAPA